MKAALGRGGAMATVTEERSIPSTPAIGIALIILGVLLALNIVDLEVLLGLAGIIIGLLILVGEFA